MADVLRSVLFVDFDNVFFALQSADKEAAKAFANDPQGWLDAIESGALIEEVGGGPSQRRRILMRRCYANPAVMRYFRAWFTRSGFQIVDCPPLTGKGKNSADIYMVVDMLDALRHETRFDEFIILSGDADFTPVLTRLRAFDRRSVIYSNAVTASAYKSLCDAMITEERLIDMAVDEDEEPRGQAAAPAPRPERRAEPRSEPRPDPRAEVRSIPIEQLRPGVAEPRAPGQRRTYPPRAAGPRDETTAENAAGGARLPRVPEPMEALVRRVAAATNVPPFAPEVYAQIFRALAAEVHQHGFSLNRTVNAVIRRLGERGLKLRPQSVAFVIKGLMLSGHEFADTDTAGTLAKAFRRQVLYLSANADLALADHERSAVGAWIVGALRSVPTAEATSSDEVPNDAIRAAEAAGVSIEEVVNPLPPADAESLRAEYPTERADRDPENAGEGEDAHGEDADGEDFDPDETGEDGEDGEPDDEEPEDGDPDDAAGNPSADPTLAAPTGVQEPVEPTGAEAPAKPARKIEDILARIRTPRG